MESVNQLSKYIAMVAGLAGATIAAIMGLEPMRGGLHWVLRGFSLLLLASAALAARDAISCRNGDVKIPRQRKYTCVCLAVVSPFVGYLILAHMIRGAFL